MVFKTTPIIEHLMLFLGMICGGRSALTWAAVHRMHHAKSDTEHDPHSPIYKGSLTVLTSRWRVEKIPKKYIVDLLRNPRIVWWHRFGKYIHLFYTVLVFILFGIWGLTVFVALPFAISWIGFGMLNYVAHKDGQPKDVPLMNLIAPGEGWHLYHHNNPGHYRLNKYDFSGWIIERFFIKAKPGS